MSISDMVVLQARLCCPPGQLWRARRGVEEQGGGLLLSLPPPVGERGPGMRRPKRRAPRVCTPWCGRGQGCQIRSKESRLGLHTGVERAHPALPTREPQPNPSASRRRSAMWRFSSGPRFISRQQLEEAPPRRGRGAAEWRTEDLPRRGEEEALAGERPSRGAPLDEAAARTLYEVVG